MKSSWRSFVPLLTMAGLPVGLALAARGLGVDALAAAFAVIAIGLTPGAGIVSLVSPSVRMDALYFVRVTVLSIAAVTMLLIIAMLAGLGIAFITIAAIILGLGGCGFGALTGRPVALPRPSMINGAGVVIAAAASFAAATRYRVNPLGDVSFHLGRIRLILGSDQLHRLGLTEIAGGSDHPGYAIPGWHTLTASASWIAGTDPTTTLHALAAAAVVIAAAVAWVAGGLIHRHARIVALVAAIILGFWVTLRWNDFGLPGTFTVQLLVPASLVLAISLFQTRSRIAFIALAGAGIAIVASHSTYAVAATLLALGAAIATATRGEPGGRLREAVRLGSWSIAALGLPFVFYGLWTLELALDARSTAVRRAAGEIGKRFENVVIVGPFTVYSPADLIQTSPLIVAAIALALIGWRCSSAGVAFIGAAAALAFTLFTPPVFSGLVSIVSVSQAQRMPLMLPAVGLCAVAVIGAASLTGRRRRLAFALLAGTSLAVASLAHVHVSRVLAVAVVIAVGAGAVALGARSVNGLTARATALAALCLFIPILVLIPPKSPASMVGSPLSPDFVMALRALPDATVVLATPTVAYRITGETRLTVFASMPTHVANTSANRPYQRSAVARELLSPATPAPERLALARANGIRVVALVLPASQQLATTLTETGWPVLNAGPTWQIVSVPTKG